MGYCDPNGKGGKDLIGVMIVEDDPMVMEINSKFLKRVEGFTFLKGVPIYRKQKNTCCLKNRI